MIMIVSLNYLLLKLLYNLCIIEFIEFQRSSDRSWKQLWGILRGPILFFYKDRQNQVF